MRPDRKYKFCSLDKSPNLFSEISSSTFSLWTKWLLIFVAANLNLQYAWDTTKQNSIYKTERGRQKQDAIRFLPVQNWNKLLLAEDNLSWVTRAAMHAGEEVDIEGSGMEIQVIS